MKRILLPILVIGVLLLSACGAPAEAPATPTTYTLSVSVSSSGGGSVSPLSGQYEEGTQVTLTATPASGYTFDYWGGDASGHSTTVTITMDSDKSISAHFKVTKPEPTPAKPEIKGATTYFDRGYFYIVGEVLNVTNSNINFMKVVATFYNETGAVIGTSFTYTELDIILPNDAAPFEISSYPDKIQPASYKLSGDYNTTSEQPFAGLNIKSHSASIDDMGYYKIVGEVENTSSMSAEFVKVVVTYYDSSRNVIGTDFTYTEIDIVSAGGTAPFELSSYPRMIKPASYNLQVEGSEY